MVGAGAYDFRSTDGTTITEVRALAPEGVLPELIESGASRSRSCRPSPLPEIAEAHRASEDGRVRGTLVVLVG